MIIYDHNITNVVLYGCETWSLTLREECRLRVFEKSVLRRIFGPKRDEVTEELRGVYKVLMGKPEGKTPMGRLRCRWEDNIKMNLQEVGGGSMDWIGLVHDRDRWRALVNAVINLRVP
jgi:hypothetical protein